MEDDYYSHMILKKEMKHCYLFIIFNGSVVWWKHFLLIFYTKKKTTTCYYIWSDGNVRSVFFIYLACPYRNLSHLSFQSLKLGGLRGTTDDVATIVFHPFLSSAGRRESPNPIPVHSLMLSSNLFFCLPLLLAPFTVPCRIIFAMPEDLEMWPYHLSFRFFTMVRSSYTPIAFWLLLRTSSFVTWSL